jgi:hypothetical protein
MKSHCYKRITVTIVVLSTTFATPAQSGASGAAPPELYHLMREAELKVREADKKMYERMAECSDLLSKNFREGKRIPQSLADFEIMLAHSRLSAAKNPYYETEMLAREMPPSASHGLRFEILTDYALGRNSCEFYANHPPRSWTGLPGTITITQNTENMYAVRGYGMDGKPIRSSTTNSAFYIFKDCAESDD